MYILIFKGAGEMSIEATAILRSILYQLKMTDDIKVARRAVAAMCMDDDIAAVEKIIADAKAEDAAAK
jgi:hypothetical protein